MILTHLSMYVSNGACGLLELRCMYQVHLGSNFVEGGFLSLRRVGFGKRKKIEVEIVDVYIQRALEFYSRSLFPFMC